MKQEENLYTPDCIRTVSGIYVNVFDPKPEMFVIEDIAHALSFTCRFGGHLPHYYSVAQHSITCSKVVSEENAMAALLHDAAEAYLTDMPSPIKKRLPDFVEIENNLMRVIALRFGFEYPLHDEVKEADKELLEMEWARFVLRDSSSGLRGPVFPPDIVRKDFLSRYERINELRTRAGELVV